MAESPGVVGLVGACSRLAGQPASLVTADGELVAGPSVPDDRRGARASTSSSAGGSGAGSRCTARPRRGPGPPWRRPARWSRWRCSARRRVPAAAGCPPRSCSPTWSAAGTPRPATWPRGRWASGSSSARGTPSSAASSGRGRRGRRCPGGCRRCRKPRRRHLGATMVAEQDGHVLVGAAVPAAGARRQLAALTADLNATARRGGRRAGVRRAAGRRRPRPGRVAAVGAGHRRPRRSHGDGVGPGAGRGRRAVPTAAHHGRRRRRWSSSRPGSWARCCSTTPGPAPAW